MTLVWATQHPIASASRDAAFHSTVALNGLKTDDADALASPTDPRLAMAAPDVLLADGQNGRSLANCVLGIGLPGKNKPLPHLPRLEHGKMFRVFSRRVRPVS